MTAEARLKEMGLSLPDVPKPVAAYVPAVVSEGIVFISGQLPLVEGRLKYKGKVGKDLTVEAASDAAKICALNCLAAARQAIGSLDLVERVLRVAGYVNSAPEFSQQPQVVNGASDILLQVFGEAGRHARIAVGVSGLPLDAPVEVEMILKIG